MSQKRETKQFSISQSIHLQPLYLDANAAFEKQVRSQVYEYFPPCNKKMLIASLHCIFIKTDLQCSAHLLTEGCGSR